MPKLEEEEEGESDYYSEARLDRILKQDIFSLGILILECIQEIPDVKRKTELDKETLNEMVEICRDIYSPFFFQMVSGMIVEDPAERIDLDGIRDYLQNIYSGNTGEEEENGDNPMEPF